MIRALRLLGYPGVRRRALFMEGQLYQSSKDLHHKASQWVKAYNITQVSPKGLLETTPNPESTTLRVQLGTRGFIGSLLKLSIQLLFASRSRV